MWSMSIIIWTVSGGHFAVRVRVLVCLHIKCRRIWASWRRRWHGARLDGAPRSGLDVFIYFSFDQFLWLDLIDHQRDRHGGVQLWIHCVIRKEQNKTLRTKLKTKCVCVFFVYSNLFCIIQWFINHIQDLDWYIISCLRNSTNILI